MEAMLALGYKATELKKSRNSFEGTTDTAENYIKSALKMLVKWRIVCQKRCSWVKMTMRYIAYHDQEWGQPFMTTALFLNCSVETYQAGLSWETVLNKRQASEKHFMAIKFRRWRRWQMGSWLLLENQPSSEIVPSSFATRANPQHFTSPETYGSFDTYLWSLLRETIVNDDILTIARHLLKQPCLKN